MKRFALVLILALVVLAAASAITSADEARQTCAVRGDWGLYSVVFGDTLSGIARRFGTTYTQLMAGNCLTNTVIHVGQQLRVPNSGTGRTLRVPATFQSYEGGFMIWRADTGSILAAANTGKYFSFGSTTYGYLPDNPIATPTPKDRIRPVMGFGKVWAFFPDVSKALGWALLPEQGFTTLIYTPPNGEYQEVIVPDGRTAHFGPTGWGFFGGGLPIPTPVPTPIPQPTPGPNYNPIRINGTFQQFEKGFMIWRGDEGAIWAFYGATSGLMGAYPVAVYAGLPVTVESAPAGKVKPIMGFGKVWSNFPDVRNGLGWAVAGELSYTMTYQNAKDWPGFTVTMPTGRTIYATRNTLWNLGADGGAPNTPPPPNPQVISTQAAFEPFENGFTVWRQDTGAVEVFYNANSRFMSYAESTYKSLPDNPVTDLPPQGRFKPVSGFGKVWGNFGEVRTGLGWGTAAEQGFTATYRVAVFAAIINAQQCLSLPDGRSVNVWYSTGGGSGATWQYVAGCG